MISRLHARTSLLACCAIQRFAERTVTGCNWHAPDFPAVSFFGKLAPTEVVLEACCGLHHWARALGCLGHRVKLIPPQYVKPFVKRAKNDRKDAEAISEVAARPSMRSVPVKTVEQQAETMLVKHREMLVSQQTQAINALRGHAAEFGVIAAQGSRNVAALLAALAGDGSIPPRHGRCSLKWVSTLRILMPNWRGLIAN